MKVEKSADILREFKGRLRGDVLHHVRARSPQADFLVQRAATMAKLHPKTPQWVRGELSAYWDGLMFGLVDQVLVHGGKHPFLGFLTTRSSDASRYYGLYMEPSKWAELTREGGEIQTGLFWNDGKPFFMGKGSATE